jgi:hypothetical protein
MVDGVIQMASGLVEQKRFFKMVPGLSKLSHVQAGDLQRQMTSQRKVTVRRAFSQPHKFFSNLAGGSEFSFTV